MDCTNTKLTKVKLEIALIFFTHKWVNQPEEKHPIFSFIIKNHCETILWLLIFVTVTEIKVLNGIGLQTGLSLQCNPHVYLIYKVEPVYGTYVIFSWGGGGLQYLFSFKFTFTYCIKQLYIFEKIVDGR